MFWLANKDENEYLVRKEQPTLVSASELVSEEDNRPGSAKALEEARKKLSPDEMVEGDFPTYDVAEGYMSSDETGSEERFENRVAVFKKEEKPVYKHHFWWFVHNCVAHPAIGLVPCKSTFDFHDWTSKKINGK